MYKYFQRRTYTFLNTCWGFSLVLLLSSLIIVSIVLRIGNESNSSVGLRGSEGLFYSEYDFQDNIAQKHVEKWTAYGSIDVVYTWVNGSDPIWLKKKEIWARKNRGDDELSTVQFNNTETNTTSTSLSEDDTMSNNRYRDSEELRYSLRSLLQYAPWIRHIYLVTDNQIPNWLNLETSRLSIVTHEEIFANQSHLPVFSSPAIEANIHRIPGLSKKFIYFNDDVFLGRPITPADFVSLEQSIQHFILAWDVPKCAPGCSESWIGDGFCDKACNVSSCGFDFPDCINGTNVPGSPNYQGSSGMNSGNGGTSYSTNNNLIYCNSGCPDSWLHDKICDSRCNNEDCGYDLGDCGMDLVYSHYTNSIINIKNSIIYGNGVIPEDKSIEIIKPEVEEDEDMPPYMHDYYMDEEDYQDFLGYEQEQLETSQETINNSSLPSNMTNTNTAATNTIATANTTLLSDDETIGPTSYSRYHAYNQQHYQQYRNAQQAKKTAKETHQQQQQQEQEDVVVPALQIMYGTKAVYFDISFLPCYIYEHYVQQSSVDTTDNITVVHENTDHNNITDTFAPPSSAPTISPTTYNTIPALKTIHTSHHDHYCPLFHPSTNQSNEEEGEFASIPFQYKTAITSDTQNLIIQHANVNSRHHVLTVLLYYGQAEVIKPSKYPVDVWFTVTGEWIATIQDPITNATKVKEYSSSIQFLLRIEDPNTFLEYGKSLQQQADNNHSLLPVPMHHITSQYMHCIAPIVTTSSSSAAPTSLYENATTIATAAQEQQKQKIDVQILSLPFFTKKKSLPVATTTPAGTEEAKNEHNVTISQTIGYEEGLIVSMVYPTTTVDYSHHQNTSVIVTITLLNGTTYKHQYPWSDMLLQYDDVSHSFSLLPQQYQSTRLQIANHAFEQYLHSFFADYMASFQSIPVAASSSGQGETTQITPVDMLVNLRTLRNQFNTHRNRPNFVEKKGILFTVPLPFIASEIPSQYLSVLIDVVQENDSVEVLLSMSGLFQYGTYVEPSIATAASSLVITEADFLPSHANNTLSPNATSTTISTNTTTAIDTAAVDLESPTEQVIVEEPHVVLLSNEESKEHNDQKENNTTASDNNSTSVDEATERRRRRLSSVSTTRRSHYEPSWNEYFSSLTDAICSFMSFSSTNTKPEDELHSKTKHLHHSKKHPLPTTAALNAITSTELTQKLESFFSYAETHYDELLDHLTIHHLKQTQQQEAAAEEETNFAHHRRLIDTYASSLIYVNRLYNKKFGTDSRKVPAHVPHMIDTTYMEEMQTIWSDEWQLTSSHRFRHEQDMQYAFAYYFYALNRYKLLLPVNESLPTLDEVLTQEEQEEEEQQTKPHSKRHKHTLKTKEQADNKKKVNTLEIDRNNMMKKFIHDFIDHNNDNHIDYNELRTLLILFTQKEYHLITNQTLEEMNNCIDTITTSLGTRNNTSSFTSSSTIHSTKGHVLLHQVYYPYPTIAELLTCPIVMKLYIDHVHPVYTKYYPISTTGSDREMVAFEMISDDMNTTLSQLDSIRLRQNKFICLNDNMKSPSPQLVEAVQQFLSSMFPVISPFELSIEQYNPTLYVSEYRTRFPKSLGGFATGWKEREAQSKQEQQEEAHSFVIQLERTMLQMTTLAQEYVWKPLKQFMIQSAYAVIDLLEDMQDADHDHNNQNQNQNQEESTIQSSRMRGKQQQVHRTEEAEAEAEQAPQDVTKPIIVNEDEAQQQHATNETIHTNEVEKEDSVPVATEEEEGEAEDGMSNGLVQAGLWIMVLGVFALIAIQRQLAYQHQQQHRNASNTTTTITASTSSKKPTNNTDGNLPVVIPPTKQFLAPIPKFKGTTTAAATKGLTASASTSSLTPSSSSVLPPRTPASAAAVATAKKGSMNNSQSVNQLFGLTGSTKSNPTTNTHTAASVNKPPMNKKPTSDPSATGPKKLVVVEEDYLAQLEATKRQFQQQTQANTTTNTNATNSSNNNSSNSNSSSSSLAMKFKQLNELDRDDYHEALKMMASYDIEDDEPPSTFVPFAARNKEQVVIRMSQSNLALSDLVGIQEEEEDDEGVYEGA